MDQIQEEKSYFRDNLWKVEIRIKSEHLNKTILTVFTVDNIKIKVKTSSVFAAETTQKQDASIVKLKMVAQPH